MITLPELSDPLVHASLQQIDILRRDRRLTERECVIKTYEFIAAWVHARAKLAEADLTERIPELVFEVGAVKFDWIEYPPRRQVWRTKTNWFPEVPVEERYTTWQPIPEVELVDNIGRFRLPAGGRDQFLKVLRGPISVWRVKILQTDNISAAPKIPPPKKGKPAESVFGANLKRLVKSVPMTWTSFAALSKVHISLIRKHRRGSTEPSVESMRAYIKALTDALGRSVKTRELTTATKSKRQPPHNP